jgi:heptosyltransferase II
MEASRILIRATNWVGDAVMSLPALAAVRNRFPSAEITVLARPWVAGLYSREPFADRLILHQAPRGLRGLPQLMELARDLRRRRFDCAILLQNAFEAALVARLAGIPRRIGYDRDARGWLLTDAVPVPQKGSIPDHQQFYYLELLRRAGLLTAPLPPAHPASPPAIRLHGAAAARAAGLDRYRAMGLPGAVVGVSPGAAYGGAKRWLPERFAAAAATVAEALDASVAVFGSAGEAALCAEIAAGIRDRQVNVLDLCVKTALEEFVELAAACRAYLTNDSGAMHIASALGVPTVAVFGATDHVATGPTGPLARVVRHDVECSPCLLRECPIDHRCMTAVEAAQVAGAALQLVQVRV